jgi:hypothetical protein
LLALSSPTYDATAMLRGLQRLRSGAKLAVLPLLAPLVYLRDPLVFDSPRLWAEEGSHYFHSALIHDGVGGLVNVSAARHNPYFHGIPQVATWLAAHAVPLELAPLVTTAAWVLIACSVVLVVLTSRAALLDAPWRRAVALAAPFLAVGNGENWANTLGAHFWADYAMLLLVLEGARVAGRRRDVSIASVAVLGFLSPTSWMLVPAAGVLCLDAWRAHRPYLLALMASVGFQLVLAATVFAGTVRRPASLAEGAHLVLSKMVIWPLAGTRAGQRYTDYVMALDADRFGLVACLAAAILILLLVAFVRAGRRDVTTAVLVWTYLAAIVGFVGLGLHVRDLVPLLHGARYAWLPHALMLLALCHHIDWQRVRAKDAGQMALAGTPGLAMITGVREYRYSDEVIRWAHGPSWRNEVAHHERDHSYTALQIWPNGWVVNLPDRSRP